MSSDPRWSESTRQYQTLLEAIPQIVWTANAEGRVEYANSQWFEYTGLSIEQAGPLGCDDLLHPEDRERTWSAWNQAMQAGSVFEIEHRVKRVADGAYRWYLVRAVPFRGGATEITTGLEPVPTLRTRSRLRLSIYRRKSSRALAALRPAWAHDFNNLLLVILGGASYAMETIEPSHPAQDMLRGVVRAGERAAELTGKMLAYAGGQPVYRTDRYQPACPRRLRLSASFDSGYDSAPHPARAGAALRYHRLAADAAGDCGTW